MDSLRRPPAPSSFALALALAAVLLFGATVAAPGAHAANTAEFYGVNTQSLTKDTTIDPRNWGAYFGQLQAGQMSVSRVQVSWQTAEPSAPVNGVHTYNWDNGGTGSRDSIDYTMYALASKGVRAAPLIATVPSWVNRNAYRMTSANYPDFAAFIAAFATRYGPGGAFWAEHPELTPLPTKDYEIWTEANSTNFWTGKSDPGEYALAMKTIWPVLHQAQGDAVLLASLGWQNVSSFLDSFWSVGGGAAIDGIGFHPYAPHAPAVIGLVTSLRGKLSALGRGGLPVMITESGQPVVYSGSGAVSAGEGNVTDAARAASMSYAADALARANCNVQQFLSYTITGSETNKEPISEGYMGIFHHSDGSPNITGAAMQRASRRWVAQFSGGSPATDSLALCGGTTPDAKLLPLGLKLTKAGDTCVYGVTTYDGNPVEGANLEFHGTGRGTYSRPTDAHGFSEVCLTNGPAVSTFDVITTIPNSGRSALYRCGLPVNASASNCVPVVAAPAAPGSPAPNADTPVAPGTPGATAVCECSSTLTSESLADSPNFTGGSTTGSTSATTVGCWKASVSATKPAKGKRGVSKIKGKGTLSCLSQKAGLKIRFVVAIRKKHSLKDVKVRTVTLKNLRTVGFTINYKVAKGDQLVLLHAVAKKPKDVAPRIRTATVLKAPK
jgi:hypothetical protein